MRPSFDPETRYELHGIDLKGRDHVVHAAATLQAAADSRGAHERMKSYYVLDTLTRNKASLNRIRDIGAWV